MIKYIRYNRQVTQSNMNLRRIPTGIDSIDTILRGGLPSGSLILLQGEIGAGDIEFAYTGMTNTLKSPNVFDVSADTSPNVCYITFTRSQDDILKELAFSFPNFYKTVQDNIVKKRIKFKEFSKSYFATSFIPAKWRSSDDEIPSFESLKWTEEEKDLVESLIDYLDKNAKGSIVYLDSLTALAQYCLSSMEWKDLIMFLRGLQRAAKIWDGLVYAILSDGIFTKSHQEEIAECMDGVIVFEWEKMALQRQRIMYLKKFKGVLPLLDSDNIVNFELQISSIKGFEVSNIKRVRGR